MSLAASNAKLLGGLLPAGPQPRPCEQDFKQGRRLNLYVYDLPWAYNGQIVEYVESQARLQLAVLHLLLLSPGEPEPPEVRYLG